jgi:hypothetical protein
MLEEHAMSDKAERTEVVHDLRPTVELSGIAMAIVRCGQGERGVGSVHRRRSET